MLFSTFSDPLQLAATVVVILFVLTVHEFSHALAADFLGDDTAKKLGRLTLNPLAHLDIFGTVLMFIAGFGWAKPVPVNPYNLKNPKTEMIFIAAAGPLSNLITAAAAGAAIRFFLSGGAENFLASPSGIFAGKILFMLLFYSVALAVFNLIPIPPLDGSRIIYGILPNRIAGLYARFEKFGIILLFGIFIFAREGFMKTLWTPVKEISAIFSGL